MRKTSRVLAGVAAAALLAGGGFLVTRAAFRAPKPPVVLSPQEQLMQDELSGYLRQLPPEYTVTLARPDAFDLPTRLCLARSNVLLEGLTREKLAATPFDEGSLANFEAEISSYTPLPPTQPDSNGAFLASIRASSALTTYFVSWACAGPFTPQSRAAWEGYAIRLSADTDLEVRQQCAQLLWVISNFPEKAALSAQGAGALEALRNDPFIKQRWNDLISKALKSRVERAGRTWPSEL